MSSQNDQTIELLRQIITNFKLESDGREFPTNFDNSDLVSVSTPDSNDEEHNAFRIPKRNLKTDSQEYHEFFSQEYIDFTYENPTIYHVVKYFSTLLENHGFKFLDEKKPWGSITSGLYYTTRNNTSLSCFIIGDNWKPEYGVGLVGSHIDVLTAKLKPDSHRSKVEGYELLGVSPYAGALSELWWDRDLYIGGKVLVRDYKTNNIVTKLIKSPHPIARIPSLAPHFGLKFSDFLNKENRAVPVVAFDGAAADATEEILSEAEKKSPLVAAHSITLLRFIAELAKCEVADLVQLDLDIYDGQKGTIGGLKKDFLFAPRVDDRICSFAAIYGLLESIEKNNFEIPSKSFSLVTLYDNEEIGSLSKQGAQGGLSESVIERAIDCYITDKEGYSLESLYKIAYANTIILSADVNHAFNPNFNDVYSDNHKPLLNTGMTIAFDERAMATDVTGRALIEQVAILNGDTLQKFHIRNDSRSGGTIGPYISSKTGARVIDLGIAQWSMHSIRAAVGSKDVGLGVKFFSGFYKYWRQVADQFEDF